MRFFNSTIIFSFLVFSTGINLAVNEEICGIWINTNYDHVTFQKRVFNCDGTFSFYRYESSSSPEFEGTYSVDEKWKDSENNIWYRLKTTAIKSGKPASVWYFLTKISDSAKQLEFVFHVSDYLEEIKSDLPTYRIYYRH